MLAPSGALASSAVGSLVPAPRSLAAPVRPWQTLRLGVDSRGEAGFNLEVRLLGVSRHGAEVIGSSRVPIVQILDLAHGAGSRSVPLGLALPGSASGALAARLWVRLLLRAPPPPWSACGAAQPHGADLRFSGRHGFAAVAVAPGWVWG